MVVMLKSWPYADWRYQAMLWEIFIVPKPVHKKFDGWMPRKCSPFG
jgi:hypothetical protein